MLRDDFAAYLAGDAQFGAGHFSALLIEDDAYADPAALFGGLPRSSSLISRIEQLTSDFLKRGEFFVPDPERRLDETAMSELVAQHSAMMADLGEDEGEDDEAAALRAAPIAFLNDRDRYQAMMSDRSLPWNELPDLLDDIYLETLLGANSKYAAIDEAVLELTKSKEVTMWVMSDFIDLQLKLKPGYDIYCGGGLIGFPREQTIVHIR